MKLEGGGKLLQNLVLFGRVCRALGMQITPNRMLDVAQALELIDLSRKRDVYDTMQALMVTHKRDMPLFDEAFRLFWKIPVDEEFSLAFKWLSDNPPPRPPSKSLLPPAAEPDDLNLPEGEPDFIATIPTYSTNEVLRQKNFSEMTGEELLQTQQVMERLPWSLGMRKSRRFVPGAGRQTDLRRLMRGNLRYGGEILSLPTRKIKLKPRPLVLLCDISGSMERYTRVLLQFTYTLANTMYQVEAFVFATQLTRITRSIRRKSVDAALKEVGMTVKDWGAGTRTGDALKLFNYRWSRRVLGRGAVVLLITDGWDRGDPEMLRREIARLQHSCHRLIWLNPLLGSEVYEPLTRGAQALLPFVDDFLPVHNLASLDALARELWRVDWRRPQRTAYAHLIK
ncbi:MAG: VWA domain-containing protein [Anaerolineae bacterium]|nr:VWA domain-containing protein [Anaerolineae bacterium]